MESIVYLVLAILLVFNEDTVELTLEKEKEAI